MRQPILGKVAFPASVALMLAFGTREVLSAPVAAATSAISCETNEECQEYCELKHPGQAVVGWCDNPPFGPCHCDLF